MHEIRVELPVAQTVGDVPHHPHVAVRLDHAVTACHRSVWETLFLPELRVSVSWILDVVSKSIRTRSLEKRSLRVSAGRLLSAYVL